MPHMEKFSRHDRLEIKIFEGGFDSALLVLKKRVRPLLYELKIRKMNPSPSGRKRAKAKRAKGRHM